VATVIPDGGRPGRPADGPSHPGHLMLARTGFLLIDGVRGSVEHVAIDRAHLQERGMPHGAAVVEPLALRSRR